MKDNIGPNFEELFNSLTEQQKEVLAIIEETDPDLLQEQAETGDMQLFCVASTIAKHNGADMMAILFGEKENYYEFLMFIYEKVADQMNYKVFVRIGEPVGIDTGTKLYKEFKQWAFEEHGETFKKSNLFHNATENPTQTKPNKKVSDDDVKSFWQNHKNNETTEND
tara:strand:+ start:35 stop:535 length:501 start_codon:yes stop_codon:yes gene_type:complete